MRCITHTLIDEFRREKFRLKYLTQSNNLCTLTCSRSKDRADALNTIFKIPLVLHSSNKVAWIGNQTSGFATCTYLLGSSISQCQASNLALMLRWRLATLRELCRAQQGNWTSHKMRFLTRRRGRGTFRHRARNTTKLDTGCNRGEASK